MNQRGRKSAASLAVINSNIEAIERPQPPVELTDEQREIWCTVVNRLQADWFPPETHPLLAQYCRHVVSVRRIAQLIEQAESDKAFCVEDYDRLLKMQEREGRALSSLATRMRLTQQSTVHNETKKPKGATRKPWDV